MKPGTLTVMRVLAATSLRRWWNRVSALYRKKKPGRGATGRKGGRSLVTLVLLGALFLMQAFVLSYQFALVTAQAVEARDGAKARAAAAEDLDEGGAIGLGGDNAPVRRNDVDFGSRAWVRTAPVVPLLRCHALLLSLLVLALVFIGLGTGNPELSQVGWSMEWLFGFPVPTRSLLLAKTGEYALTAVFTWFTLFPLSSTILWNAGWGAWGLLGGAVITLLTASAVGALRVLIETALRKRLALHGIKNVQAICTLLGMLLFFTVFALVSRSVEPTALLSISDAVGGPLLYGPIGAAIGIVLHPGAAALFLGWTLGAVWLCLRGAERLVATGLVSEGGPYQGTRKPERPARRIGGMLSKDALLLARDRNLFVQTLVVPLVIVAFQFVVNPAFGRASSPRTVAVLAYGIAAYVVAFGGLRVLVAEQNALWLLYSLPQRLDRLLRRKTVLWGIAASIYAVGVLAYQWRPAPSMEIEDWLAPFLALGGVFLCAFLAGAMGTIGFDPFEKEISKKVHPEWSMLYMAVASIYGVGLATGDLWVMLRVNALTIFLVYAVWNRVQRRVPYLLDPTAVPPRRIEIADGLVAAFLFAFTQGLALRIGIETGGRPAFVLALAYAVAAAITVALSLYVLWRMKVKRLFLDLGFRRPRLRAVLAGALTGLVLAVGALGYLEIFRENFVFRSAREQAAGFDVPSKILFAVVTVVLAPLLEEFLFRGLLFRGFTRALRLPFAVMGSALIFALLHPATSFPPVFALGVATAILLQRTGLIWAPIAAHVAYNAVVTYAQFA